MKIKFESDNDMPLSKPFNIIYMIIVAASGIEKNGQYYPQIFYMNACISYKNAAIRKN